MSQCAKLVIIMPKNGQRKILGCFFGFGFWLKRGLVLIVWHPSFAVKFQYVSYCVSLFSKQWVFYGSHNTVFIESLAVET